MNRHSSAFALLLLLAALFAAPGAASAAESYDNCKGFIASVPASIGTAGTWCLNADLSTAITSGNAITVNTNDVTIDCNNFKLDGLAAGLATIAHGVHANGRNNVTIRNCNIRGFEYGVMLLNGSGHLVENNHFDGNTVAGMRVDGDRSQIRGNQVVDSGGSTVAAWAFGILAYNSTDILDNTVSGVAATTGGGGAAYGIYTSSNLSGSVNGNHVRDIVKDGASNSYAIYNDLSDRTTIRGNDLLGDGSAGGRGVRCATANGSAKNNIVTGFPAGIVTCSNDGGNVIAP